MKSSRSLSAIERKAGAVKRAAAAIVLGAGLMSAAGTAALAEQNFSGVRVDTSALDGGGRYIGPALEASLRHYFQDELRGGRDAPVLVVRVTGVTLDLSPAVGGGGYDGGGNGSSDYLQGEALIVAKGGRVIERYPMLAALAADQGGWYLPNFQQRKARALSDHYAYWLRKQLPDR